MDNSEQSSGEWSDSDGELIIDTPSSTAALPPSRKEPQGKRRKEAGQGAGPRKQPNEEAVDDGEGGCG